MDSKESFRRVINQMYAHRNERLTFLRMQISPKRESISSCLFGNFMFPRWSDVPQCRHKRGPNDTVEHKLATNSRASPLVQVWNIIYRNRYKVQRRG